MVTNYFILYMIPLFWRIKTIGFVLLYREVRKKFLMNHRYFIKLFADVCAHSCRRTAPGPTEEENNTVKATLIKFQETHFFGHQLIRV